MSFDAIDQKFGRASAQPDPADEDLDEGSLCPEGCGGKLYWHGVNVCHPSYRTRLECDSCGEPQTEWFP